ncbi:MAG: helix-turn-helix transcriptional regulator [Frankia sp.]
MSIAEVRLLPPVVDLSTAARAFGYGRTHAYQLAKDDTFPCPIHRTGRRYRIRTSDILEALKSFRTG